jgi:hypothetical protein
MSFDEEPDPDEHARCRHEIHELGAERDRLLDENRRLREENMMLRTQIIEATLPALTPDEHMLAEAFGVPDDDGNAAAAAALRREGMSEVSVQQRIRALNGHPKYWQSRLNHLADEAADALDAAEAREGTAGTGRADERGTNRHPRWYCVGNRSEHHYPVESSASGRR